MHDIEFEKFNLFRKNARCHFSKHKDYDSHIKNDYPLVTNEGRVIYCAHSKHFDIILSESWREMSRENHELENFTDLLRAVWDSPVLKESGQSFRHDLMLDLEDFIKMVKRQYFYFDNGKEQFVVPLYRLIADDNEVIGGFFHFLIKHFEMYNHLHPNNSNNFPYFPNNILGVLISTSTWPDEEEEKRFSEKEPRDFKFARTKNCNYIDKQTMLNNRRDFKVIHYYDSRSDLFVLTTFYPC